MRLFFMASDTKLGEYGVARFEANALRFKAASELLSGIKNVKVAGREAYFIKNFSNPAQVYASMTAKNQVIKQLPRYLLESLTFGGILGITLYMVAAKQNLDTVVSYCQFVRVRGVSSIACVAANLFGINHYSV